MTPQEAINFYKSFLSLIPENSYKEAAEQSILALEKQIPKKPTHEATLFKSNTCPCCKNVVDESITSFGVKCRVLTPHCKICGQALDWGENE